MDADQYLRAGQLDEALTALQAAVRSKPADPRLRVFLFQLLCVMGQWERALTQLQVLEELDAEKLLLARVFRQVIQCEVLRPGVFSGKRSPVIFGEPVEWISWLIQASQLMARSAWSEALELRRRALEAAPVSPGRIGDTPFAWMADADSRLGPVLELILEGTYYWVPFFRIRELRIELPKPPELRNAVWVPAHLTWTNGGTASGFIPTRYPDTEKSADGLLRLARKTEWREEGGELFLGLGQRLLATDQDHFPLLEPRTVEFFAS